MTKYLSESEYYNIANGEQISKKLAKRDYDSIRCWKIVKTKNQTAAYGYEHITIIITYIHECSIKKQLKLL